MVDAQARKLNIIELVMGINDDRLLAAIEREALQLVERTSKMPNVWDAVRPVRKNISLDQMIREQGTKPIDTDTFFSLASEIGLDDPIDDLLADLTA